MRSTSIKNNNIYENTKLYEKACDEYGLCNPIRPVEYGSKHLELTGGLYNFNIDESGKSMPGHIKISSDRDEYYVVVGLFTVPQNISSIHNKCELIKNKYDYTGELKYKHILPFDKSKRQRSEMMIEIISLIVDQKLPFIVTIEDRKLQRHEYGDIAYSDQYAIVPYTINQLARFLSTTNESSAAIVYNDEGDDTNKIKNELNKWKVNGFRDWNNQHRLKRIINYYPVNSIYSIGVQLADVCCGAFIESIYNNNHKYYDKLKKIQLWTTFLHPPSFYKTSSGNSIKRKYSVQYGDFD